jgi:hypothetical protein
MVGRPYTPYGRNNRHEGVYASARTRYNEDMTDARDLLTVIDAVDPRVEVDLAVTQLRTRGVEWLEARLRDRFGLEGEALERALVLLGALARAA